MSHLDSPCLKLNANWAVLGIISVRQAYSDAAAGAVTLLKFSEGYPCPFKLEDWLRLDVEPGEDYVTTSRLHELKKVLVPRVCITTHYNQLILKEQACSPENLLRRYDHKDAVTGKPLQRENFSKEHVRPRSKGGSNGWHNEVPMDRQLNSKRGNKSYRKLGLKKPKILGAPPPLLPINTMVNKNGYKEWDMFGIARHLDCVGVDGCKVSTETR